jgi:3-oxoacyl-[acyl-carrier protein] reductase
MDLGIAGRKAIVCAASKGLGKACAMSLGRGGVELVINSRTEETLQATAEEIRKDSGAKVTVVASDITTDEGRAAVLRACPAPDILVNNAGGPPPGNFRDWEREDWIKAVDANMLTPIFLIKATVDGMIERRFGRVVNITSQAVLAPIEVLGLSNGARAGLTGFIGGLSRSVAKHNVAINNMLPGPFETDRFRSGVRIAAEKAGITYEQSFKIRQDATPAGRVGDPYEFGEACAFLCGKHAGFIIGQNVLLDGGGFNASF